MTLNCGHVCVWVSCRSDCVRCSCCKVKPPCYKSETKSGLKDAVDEGMSCSKVAGKTIVDSVGSATKEVQDVGENSITKPKKLKCVKVEKLLMRLCSTPMVSVKIYCCSLDGFSLFFLFFFLECCSVYFDVWSWRCYCVTSKTLMLCTSTCCFL